MTEHDRVLHPGQRMRCGAARQRTVGVLVEVAGGDAVVKYAQVELARLRRRLRDLFEVHVLASGIDDGTHKPSVGARSTPLISASRRTRAAIAFGYHIMGKKYRPPAATRVTRRAILLCAF